MAFKNLANGYGLTFGELQFTSPGAFPAAVSAPILTPYCFLQALLCLVTLVVLQHWLPSAFGLLSVAWPGLVH